MTDSVAMNGTHIIISCLMQKLHSNHMDIDKTCLLMRESVYWINMKADIEQIVNQCSMCLEYQHTQ